MHRECVHQYTVCTDVTLGHKGRVSAESESRHCHNLMKFMHFAEFSKWEVAARRVDSIELDPPLRSVKAFLCLFKSEAADAVSPRAT